MEQQVYHCLRYGGLAPLSCSDEFACHGVLMNGSEAEEMRCGLIHSGKVKSGSGSLPRAQTSPAPPTVVQVYLRTAAAGTIREASLSP